MSVASAALTVARRVRESDLSLVVQLFARPDESNLEGNDAGPFLPKCCSVAYSRIQSDKNNGVLYAEIGDRLCGVCCTTFMPYVSFRNGTAALLQNVVVDPALRWQGIRRAMMQWAIKEARRRACFCAQSPTRHTRHVARSFYATQCCRKSSRVTVPALVRMRT